MPQYRKVVIKAKIARVMPLLRAVQEAEERYYLIHGEYTNDGEKLDIDWTHMIQSPYKLEIAGTAQEVYTFYPGPGLSRKFEHTQTVPGRFTCNGYGSTLYTEICATYGEPIYSWTPHYTYW
ncbi:MAG: hypothetical protein LBG46_00600 [Elusimicrobiota bacterium]|nr:hypothetical protein [Elusimicrobiota bacterium]